MGNLTASKDASPRSEVRIVSGQQVHELPDVGRQESVAEGVFYGALEVIREKIKDVEPIEVFTQALENVKPNIEVRSKRVGGARTRCRCRSAATVSSRWRSAGFLRRSAKRRAGHQRETGRRTDGRLQPRRRGDDQARQRPPHGRRQQGVRPFRLVADCPLAPSARPPCRRSVLIT